MTGTNNKEWKHFYNYVVNGYQYRVIVTKKAAIRSSGKVTTKNKIGTAAVGKVYKITKVAGRWGRLKEKDSQGRYRWITLNKVKEID